MNLNIYHYPMPRLKNMRSYSI